jgi:hypothetical protein
MVKYLVEEAGANLLGESRIKANIFHLSVCFNFIHILDYAIQ